MHEIDIYSHNLKVRSGIVEELADWLESNDDVVFKQW